MIKLPLFTMIPLNCFCELQKERLQEPCAEDMNTFGEIVQIVTRLVQGIIFGVFK